MTKALESAADGVKVDTRGNVWAGVPGEGVNVWNAEGTLLGRIKLDGAPGNLGFGEAGELFVMCGSRIYKIMLSPMVIGA